MQVNHAHDHSVDTGKIINDTDRELRCEVCGHRTVDDLYNTTIIDSNKIRIDSPRYPLAGVIVIPEELNGRTVTQIGNSAFANQNQISQISISASVTNIDSSAFENCTSLTNVTLPNNLTSIGSSAFKGCASLGSITIPNSVTNIDSSAFENCSYLQNITLSNNLTCIGGSAFKGCESLDNITIPNSVTNIDSSAFENCVELESVTVQRETFDITNLGTNVFDGCTSLEVITVPTVRFLDYKNATNWSNYSSLICYHIGGHIYTYTPYNSTTHLKECDCGYSATENHSFVYGYNVTQHWRYCTKCGYQTSKVNHSWHTEPTGRTYCTVCGYLSLVQPWSTDPIFYVEIKKDEFM